MQFNENENLDFIFKNRESLNKYTISSILNNKSELNFSKEFSKKLNENIQNTEISNIPYSDKEETTVSFKNDISNNHILNSTNNDSTLKINVKTKSNLKNILNNSINKKNSSDINTTNSTNLNNNLLEKTLKKNIFVKINSNSISQTNKNKDKNKLNILSTNNTYKKNNTSINNSVVKLDSINYNKLNELNNYYLKGLINSSKNKSSINKNFLSHSKSPLQSNISYSYKSDVIKINPIKKIITEKTIERRIDDIIYQNVSIIKSHLNNLDNILKEFEINTENVKNVLK